MHQSRHREFRWSSTTHRRRRSGGSSRLRGPPTHVTNVVATTRRLELTRYWSRSRSRCSSSRRSSSRWRSSSSRRRSSASRSSSCCCHSSSSGDCTGPAFVGPRVTSRAAPAPTARARRSSSSRAAVGDDRAWGCSAASLRGRPGGGARRSRSSPDASCAFSGRPRSSQTSAPMSGRISTRMIHIGLGRLRHIDGVGRDAVEQRPDPEHEQRNGDEAFDVDHARTPVRLCAHDGRGGYDGAAMRATACVAPVFLRRAADRGSRCRRRRTGRPRGSGRRTTSRCRTGASR